MHFVFLQHETCEPPGAVADWARSRGHSLSITHLHRGDPLPSPHTADVVVTMGGPMNVYQDRDFPWLPNERRFLEAHLSAGKPAVGICLGAQLLADALGCRVVQNPQLEVGWFPVEFTPEARQLFPSLPERLDVLHWHGDTFELPRGAIRLASSEACLNQGFVHGDRVLALQFHAEITAEGAAALSDSFHEDLVSGPSVQSAELIRSTAATACAAAQKTLYALLDDFIGRTCK